MKVKISSPGELDRHEAEVRFLASVDGRTTRFSITNYGLFIIQEALGVVPSDPLTVYAVSGRLLEAVVRDAIDTVGPNKDLYLLTHENVLRVTGSSGAGNSHAPNLWRG